MLLDTKTPLATVQEFLTAINWITDETITGLETPGEGNMNVVIRATTNKRSFILKQSRPFVQKYQDIAAPIERIETEHRFYSTLQDSLAATSMPKLLGYHPEHFLMMLEDLGQAEDMTAIYASGSIAATDLERLVGIVQEIHQQIPTSNYPQNLGLRKLNHAHIFELPFLSDNGFQLDDVQEGLQDLSLPYKHDAKLKAVVAKLGEKYLAQGDTLIHGDYYPGSWMKANEQLYVMDPEFSFVGFKEFDLGVMAAHIIMTTLQENAVQNILKAYVTSTHEELVRQLAGVEIMRRLIGLGQLPLERSLEEKDKLMKMAYNMILSS